MNQSAQTIISQLQARGVELRADGDKIRFRPKNAISPELAQQLKARKAELLRALSEPSRPHSDAADCRHNPFKPRNKRGCVDKTIEPIPWDERRPADPACCRLCNGAEFWRSVYGGHVVCLTCHPPIGPWVVESRVNIGEPTEWPTEALELIEWYQANRMKLGGPFQKEIDLAGVDMLIRHGPRGRDADRLVDDLRLLHVDPESFHAKEAGTLDIATARRIGRAASREGRM